MCAEPDCLDPVHHWFSLSYSSYLVVQRSLMEAMPLEWQRRMVAMMDELWETFDPDRVQTSFRVTALDGTRFTKDPLREYRHVSLADLPWKKTA